MGNHSQQPTAEPGWKNGLAFPETTEAHGRVCVAGLNEGTGRQGSPQILCGAHVEHLDY